MFYALQHFFSDCNSSFKARARSWWINPGKSSRLLLELILGMISIPVLQNDRHDAEPGITHLMKRQSPEDTPNNTKPAQGNAPEGFEEGAECEGFIPEKSVPSQAMTGKSCRETGSKGKHSPRPWAEQRKGLSTRAANLETCAGTAQRSEVLPLQPSSVCNYRISHSQSAGMPGEQDALTQLQRGLEQLQYRAASVCLRTRESKEMFLDTFDTYFLSK